MYPSHNATVPQLPSPSGQPAAVVLLSAAALSSSTAAIRHWSDLQNPQRPAGSRGARLPAAAPSGSTAIAHH